LARGRPWAPLAVLALLPLMLLGAVAGPATEPPDHRVLTIPVPGARKKAPVAFSHRRHKDGGIACARCHHEYQGRRNVWRQGQPVKPCADCHGLYPQRRSPDIKNAMHQQCKGCHLKLRQQGRRAGPIHCRDCHSRT
jgi:hypothetical protein